MNSDFDCRSDPRNALITFVNLDEVEVLLSAFLSFPPGLIASRSHVILPTPDGDYYISSVGVDAADGQCPGLRWV